MFLPTTDDVDEAVAREMALLVPRVKATIARMHAETTTTTQQIAALAFEKVLTAIALDSGVRPGIALTSFVADGCTQFEERAGAIVARDGRRDPADPCIALTFARWLQTQRDGDLWFRR